MVEIPVEALPDEVLAQVDLVAKGAGDRSELGGERRFGGVVLRKPLLYPARPDDLPAPARRRADQGTTQLLGFLAAVELEPLRRGRTYGAVELEVTLPESCRIVAFPGGEPDVVGLHGNVFGRTVKTLDGPGLVVHVIVEAPRELLELAGQVRCSAQICRSVGKLVHIVQTETEKSAPFAERVASGRAVRLVVAADVHAYSGRDAGGTERAQDRLATVLDRASRATGSELEDRQEGGDSFMVVFPPGIDERAVLVAFYSELASGLREANVDLSADAAMRLRVGADRGLTLRGASGWVGHGPITAARLRDCRQARDVLRGDAGVPFVFAVSDCLYRDVFSERGLVPTPASFTSAEVDMPEKGFTAKAWIHAGAAS
ncbi:hypothetical protein ABZ342_19640 [Amycolatopsis sp. NPDC005961]|uniref:hypothetical protein n=1 Tax=Amycolatopsis sp. NPDC005961 TaxID=3156720 RepID=UPI00340FAFA4